jgi:hypothetical protein
MTAQGEVILQDDGTATFRTTCMLCGKPVELAGLDPNALALFLARRGPMVQDAFPRLSASEREVLVSGSHAECFEDAFPEDGEYDVDEDRDDTGRQERAEELADYEMSPEWETWLRGGPFPRRGGK